MQVKSASNRGQGISGQNGALRWHKHAVTGWAYQPHVEEEIVFVDGSALGQL